ncbi:MAG: helix-turn-helix domain-containing protein [Oscillospiraceae bacterium]
MKLYNDKIKAFREHDPIYFARQSYSESDTIGVVNDYHIHPFCELYILIDGEVDFFIENSKYTLRAKNGEYCGIAIISGNKYHYASVKSNVYDHCYMYLSYNIFPQFDADEPIFFCFTKPVCSDNSIVVPSPESNKRLFELIDEMTRLTGSNKYGKTYIEWSVIFELMTLVGEEWNRICVKNDSRNNMPEPAVSPIVTRAYSYISENFSSIDNLSDVAAYCGVSQSYLSRVFRKELGIRPHEYLRYMRLKNAKLMLLDGFDVTSACFNSGFSDYSHFIQVFRSAEGMTPLEFQKINHVIRNDSKGVTAVPQ